MRTKILLFLLLFAVSLHAQTETDMPDATKFLPAPPDTADVHFISDRQYYEEGKAIRPTPRGKQAVSDAQNTTEYFARIFSAPLGRVISKTGTPALYRLIDLTRQGVSRCLWKTKTAGFRKRPFVEFQEATPLPWKEKEYSQYTSYPSGHAANGWGIALVLAELCPACQEALLKTAYDYGESRVIVGFHYESDVIAGRLAASAAVARLHADKTFLRLLKKAKKELR